MSHENLKGAQMAEGIPETMRAVVAYGPRDYRFERVPVPTIDAKEILVKVEGCGICAGTPRLLRVPPVSGVMISNLLISKHR